MKKLLTLIAAVFISIQLFAQAPQKMSYQAVIRNASNALVTNAPVKMRISILQGGATGTSVYSELHSATTNANGLASIEIGEGTNKTGTFSSINWGNGTYYLKTETDPNNGTNYTITGTSQLLSVPYALNANCVELSVSPVGDSVKIGCSSIVLPGATKANFEPKINNGLVAYYPFNGNANDESGNGNNGTVNGATLTNDRFGNNSRSYSFNRNTNNDISIATNPTINALSNITITAWVNLNSYAAAGEGGYNHFVNKSDQANNHQFVFASNSTQLYFYFGSGNNGFTTNNLPKLNQWAHLAVTYNYDGNVSNSKCKFYINGSLVDTKQTTTGLNQTNHNLRLGAFSNETFNRLDGKLDDVRIYNRALTQEEITYLYNN